MVAAKRSCMLLGRNLTLSHFLDHIRNVLSSSNSNPSGLLVSVIVFFRAIKDLTGTDLSYGRSVAESRQRFIRILFSMTRNDRADLKPALPISHEVIYPDSTSRDLFLWRRLARVVVILGLLLASSSEHTHQDNVRYHKLTLRGRPSDRHTVKHQQKHYRL